MLNLKEVYAGKEIIITGGVGFIGSNLARQLLNLGAHVTIVDSLIPQYGGNLFNVKDILPSVNLNVCDIRDEFAISYLLKGKQFLFNLAGQTSHLDSMLDPNTDLAINASAQLDTLEACRKVNPKVKIVFASTRQIYGVPDYLPVDEGHPIRPVDVNGINKFAGESYHMLYSKVYGIDACALRLTNTYGPRMRIKDARQTFLGIWIRSVLEKNPIKIFGDGLQLRDFNYVDDCVDAMLLAGANPLSKGKIYNLGSSEVINLHDLAAKMVDLGFGGKYELVPFPPERKAIDIGDYYSDYSLIKSELGWEPKIDLATGLKESLNFYAQNMKEYV
jgi:dTDP-glucose 4,6-dehydratase/UDP-glucose 4-epimerase